MELTYHWEGDVLIPDLELEDGNNYQTVSYTHLDVYKRQAEQASDRRTE